MVQLPVGRSASARVPATSANLGPGFDSCGLALAWYDDVTVHTTQDGTTVELSGEGSDELPRDERHLVIRALRAGLTSLDAEALGLSLTAHNTIPHGRGLGSSAAAIVGGLALAWGLARPGDDLDRKWALELAARIEGHPDNVAAAVLGGFTIAWEVLAGEVAGAAAVSLPVASELAALALVPAEVLATDHARGLLPTQVSHADAARTAGRAALLTHAITTAPEQLLAATEEWLHQRQRATSMPESYGLVQELRAAGRAALISGAGPTVLVLGERSDLVPVAEQRHTGFDPYLLDVGHGVALTVSNDQS